MTPKLPHRKSRKPAKKRMLIIVNPYATTVSDRLKNLVVYALQGRFEVETAETEAQNHAPEIGREVRDHGYDVVVAFGGDGTLNEVANGLAGTDVPVSVLPGGSTNVVCRTLGIPSERQTTLVEPPGSTETGTSVPASPFATSFSVPSPPNATTMS